MDQIRVGVIGLGLRGLGLIKQVFLKMDDIRITAVCDLYEDRVKTAADVVEEAYGERPFETTDYRAVATKDKVCQCGL